MFRKNVASQFIHFQGVDATTGGIKSGVTWTIRRCIDGTFAAGGGTVTEDGTTGWYKCALSQADTNGNNIGFNFTGTGAVPQTVNIITDGSPPDINLKNAAGTAVTLDSNNVLNTSTKYVGGTLQTARDIGLSVLLSAGSGTGQLDFTSGVVKANLAQILGTALTETAGQIAAAFKQFFDVGTPTGTMKAITNVVTTTNLTNAPTVGDLTAAMKTSVQTAADAAITANVTVIEINADADEIITTLGTPAGASIAADLAEIEGETDTLLAGVTVTTNSDKTGYALSAAGSTAMTEGYPTFQGTGTLPQLLYAILQHLEESSIAGTTKTVKKRDAATTAETLTLDSATTPTSITRAT